MKKNQEGTIILNTVCYYHPDVNAEISCERCHRPICKNDIRQIGSWQGGWRYATSTRSDLCFVCYASQIDVPTYKPLLATLVIFGILSLFVYFTGIFNSINPFSFNVDFPIDPSTLNPQSSINTTANGSFELTFFALLGLILIFLICIYIYSRMQSHKDVDQAYFFNQANGSSSNKFSNSYATIKHSLKPLTWKQHELSNITCYKCGTTIGPKDQYCPNCGHDVNSEPST